eukprot:14841624-Alexandrium_andersonii.AAC.1
MNHKPERASLSICMRPTEEMPWRGKPSASTCKPARSSPEILFTSKCSALSGHFLPNTWRAFFSIST